MKGYFQSEIRDGGVIIQFNKTCFVYAFVKIIPISSKSFTAQKLSFPLRIYLVHLLKKSLMENFIFCAVFMFYCIVSEKSFNLEVIDGVGGA